MIKIESKKLSQAVEVIQEFILEDFFPIPKNTTCMISSRGGVGKTNLALYLTSKYITNHSGNVGLWLTEDEEGNIRHRVNKLLEHNIFEEFNEDRVNLILNSPIHFSKIDNRSLVIDEASILQLKLYCIEKDIRLLILDPLLAFFGAEENNNSHARAFMQQFINWCKEIDITIVLIHHSAKGDVSSTRGAGAFIDAVRSAYVLSMPLREEGKNIVEDKEKIAKGIRVVTCTKDNRGVIPYIFKTYNNNPFELKLSHEVDTIYVSNNNIDYDMIIKNAKKKAMEQVEEIVFNEDNSFLKLLL